MKKLICMATVLLLHVTLPGCYNDLVGTMKSKDNLLKRTLVLFALPTHSWTTGGSSGGSSSGGSSGGSSSGGSSSGGPIEPPPVTNGTTITQYGITWTFDKEYQYGQFANGDYWVIGPVKIVKITPESKEILGTTSLQGFTPGAGSNATIRIMNGSEINPTPRLTIKNGVASNWNVSDRQGYDSDMYCWHPTEGKIYGPSYDSTLNAGLNVSSSNPLSLPAGTSLVSTKSKLAGGRPQLTDAAVLTVLDTVPPDGSFRPSYSGSDKTIKFNKSQIRYNVLPSLSSSGISAAFSSADTATELVAKLKRVWLDHFNHISDGAQYSSPSNNMPNYGREYSTMVGEASLLLMLSSTSLNSTFGVTKEDIAIGLIQIGIDTYGVLQNNGIWFANGGLNRGRKWPVLFAGILLGDAGMSNVVNLDFNPPLSGVYSFEPFRHRFVEDQIIFYVTQSDVSSGKYLSSDIGLPDYGIRHELIPSEDNKSWDSSYRVENGCGTAGGVLAALILESVASSKTLWNNNAYFDYMDRWMQNQTKGSIPRQQSRFVEKMWDTYRAQYGLCYAGLSNNTRTYGACAAAGVVK